MDANRDPNAVYVAWGDIVSLFLSQAHQVFNDGNKKAFFDAAPFDIKLIESSSKRNLRDDEKKRIKREKMVEGAKERWWPLFLLDSVVLQIERSIVPLTGSYCLQPHKLQAEIEKYTDINASSPMYANDANYRLRSAHAYHYVTRRRSFNQHLALQLSVYNSYIAALKVQHVRSWFLLCPLSCLLVDLVCCRCASIVLTRCFLSRSVL